MNKKIIEIAYKSNVTRMSLEKHVICNGDRDYHQCEERKCPHRISHLPHGHCLNSKKVNNSDACVAPGTVSPLDGDIDGTPVTCIEWNKKA